VVAQEGDTVTSIATRLGLSAPALASYNGLAVDTPLRRDEILALPTRVAEPAGAGSLDVTAVAGAAIDRAGTVTTTALAPAAPAAAPAPPAAPSGSEPIRHQVQRGESVYSIARIYDVPVSDIAEWNGLGPDLTVREGSFLLIPQGGPATAVQEASVTTAPGSGSPTPVPPSAAEPLPDENPPPVETEPEPPEGVAPDLGAEQTTAAATAQFVTPVEGAIIREYVKGRNDGIDIGAPAGTPVKAAGAGTVAAVTTNTDGIQIVVIKHADNLLTVYTHLDNLTIAQGNTVSRGEVIGKVRPGDPSFLHFEVRLGMDSRDPDDYLP
jgi:lipoprotein NlpD